MVIREFLNDLEALLNRHDSFLRNWSVEQNMRQGLINITGHFDIDINFVESENELTEEEEENEVLSDEVMIGDDDIYHIPESSWGSIEENETSENKTEEKLII